MSRPPLQQGLGTRLRHIHDLMEADVAEAGADLGLEDYRPRFSPVVNALVDRGPCSIRELAAAVGVTHSAASQTVAQMARAGLVVLEPGSDGRQRIVTMTERAHSLLPAIRAEWAAVEAAAAALDAELPFPLSELITAVDEALARRSFRQRIADAALVVDDPVVAPFRDALGTPASRPSPQGSRDGRR